MVLNHQKNTKLLIYGLIGTILMGVGFIGLYYDPLDTIIGSKLSLKNGTIAFELWQNPPYEVFLTIYVFNVTNHEAFVRGEDTKLKFMEIGPFVYQEFLENVNTHFNDNGTLTFEPKRKAIFRPERSIGYPHEISVIIPNLALLGIASALDRSSVFVNFAVSQLTTYLDAKPMLNMTVEEFLWGYDDPLIKLASNILPNWISFERLGVLDRLFDDGRNIVTMNIDPTVKPSKNPLLTEEERFRPYSIQKWNGLSGLTQWGYVDVNETTQHPANTRCNMLEGVYDGVLFPRHLKPTDQFRVFRKAFCRTLPIVFDKVQKSPDGFKGYLYKMGANAFERAELNDENKCYCIDHRCLPRGLSDITPCYYGIPTAVSLPHFYNSDPSVFERIEGMSPNQTKHDIFIILHPDIGIPIWAKSRAQTNLVVRDTKYNLRTKPYNNIIMPIFWSELGIDNLPPRIKSMLTIIELAPLIQIGVLLTIILAGFILFITSLINRFWLQTTNTTVQQNDCIKTPAVNYIPVKIITIDDKCQFIDRESSC